MTAPVKRALLLGVGYRHEELPLESPLNDVKALAVRLENKCGFKPENISVINNAYFIQPREVKTEVEELITKSKYGDVVLVLLTGHGLWNPDTQETCFYLGKYLRKPNIIPGTYLKYFFTELGKRCRVTVLLDFCYSEGVLGDIRPDNDTVDSSTGLVLFTSAGRTEKAAEFDGADGQLYGCLVHYITKFIDTHGLLPNNQIISMLKTEVDIDNEMKKETLKILGPEADPKVVKYLKNLQEPKMKFTNWNIVFQDFVSFHDVPEN